MNLSFMCNPSSSETYLPRIQASAEHVVAQGLTDNKPPYILYPGMNENTRKALLDLRRAYDELHQR